MFKHIFRVLSSVAGQDVQFWHMNEKEQGIRTITVDMCRKQGPGTSIFTYGIHMVNMKSLTTIYIGFGDYLHELDGSWEWHEHLQYLLVFCRVHVQRNFMRKHPKHLATHTIMQLWDTTSVHDLQAQIQVLCSTYPELSTWLRNKSKPWILAGLVCEKSHIPKPWWLFARSHTGLSESSHFVDNNFTGRKLSLLAAVLRYVDS